MHSRRVVLLAALAALPCTATAAVVRIESAEVGPHAEATARVVPLPHRWAGPGDAAPADRWYRMEVDLRASRELHAVVLHDVAMNAEVYWNDTRLGDGGRFDDPISQNFQRPLRFRIPAALVRPGANELLVRVATAPHFYGWLGPVDVGPDEALAAAFERERAWRTALPQARSVLGLVVALLAAAFFVASRDPLYGWFGASILCSTLGGLNLHVRDPPMSTQAWARLVQMAVAVSPLLFVPFAHRLAGVRRPRIERAVTAAAGAVVLLAVVVPPASFLPVFTALHLPALVVGLYGLSVLGAHLWRSSRAERVVFSATAGLLLAFAAHDIAVQFGERQGAPRYANPLGMPVLFVTFGGLVTLRFVRVFRRAERQNEELEERVREKHAELEAQFERLHLLEQERAIGQERERMMREMHDGLGGRLVEALSLAEDAEASRDEIAGSLRGSLDEMRLLVDSLDPLTDDLAVLLASIRERLEPGLRRRGIELRWEVEALRDLAHLGPSERLHVLRIVQEAFTNVLKHADASRVTLRASRAGDSVRIEVADDGRGVGPEPRGGRGLDNMRKRALALGGSLSVERSGGTVVRLALPA